MPGGPDNVPQGSYWLSEAAALDRDYRGPISNEFESLPKHAKIVIIGLGITGLSVLRNLLDHGVPTSEVIAVDARGPAGAATGRNGGHLWPRSMAVYNDWCDSLGTTTARKLLKLEFDAALDVAGNARTLEQGSVQNVRRGGGLRLFLAREKEGFAKAVASIQRAKRDGVEGVSSKLTVLSPTEVVQRLRESAWFERATMKDALLDPSHWSGAILEEDVWQMNGAQYCKMEAHHLAKRRSAQLWTQTFVHTLDMEGNSGWVMQTSRGTVRADIVVLACGAYSTQLAPYLKRRIVPVRGQVLATESRTLTGNYSDEKFPGLIFHGGDDYGVIRRDGRVVYGGWRRAAGAGAEVDRINDRRVDTNYAVACTLRATLGHYLGIHLCKPGEAEDASRGLEQAESDWTGVMAYTPNALPAVGPVPRMEGLFVCAGYHGHGMPQASMAGRAIAEMITHSNGSKHWPSWLPTQYKVEPEAEVEDQRKVSHL
eukprot:Clim_evm12s197 gene=Clim_evmTU12s197